MDLCFQLNKILNKLIKNKTNEAYYYNMILQKNMQFSEKKKTILYKVETLSL